ncbi:TrbI/VirB10 family protein [Bdellovibrio sp.]|uniref:TrbI/VirB10 family protein n=1 Tax=Bdellovibrio sp. TaxID=28201 RepID=UPI0039E5C651
MEIKQTAFQAAKNVWSSLRRLFVRKTSFSSKTELRISSFKWLGLTFVLVFVCVVLLMPNEVPVQFIEKIDSKKNTVDANGVADAAPSQRSSSNLWAAPRRDSYRGSSGGSPQVNYNTAMVLGTSGNAKTQLRAGIRLPLRILDKVVVSQEPVPVLAEMILDGETESGLRLPAGTRFYGEASFSKGADRANIVFKQISFPDGKIKQISAKALGKDGQGGVPGRVYSDGTKNTAGQVLTTFVGGLAAGSVQTDMFGRSQGGIGNGLLNAVAETARGKAQAYGENLKTEREWLEIQPNEECDAQLFESMDLQNGGSVE